MERELRRTRIIFNSMSLHTVSDVSKACRCDPRTASLWIARAREFNESFAEHVERAMKEPGHAGRATRIERLVRDFLADRPRPGCHSTYTAMQYARILELALTLPEESGRAISEWTGRELADEVHQRGICGISPRQVARFLAEVDLQPHKSDYWMNPKIDDPLEHERQVARVCDLYHDAPGLAAVGAHVISIDEKTGIQALERIAKDKPMEPGRRRKLEYEYERHGTLCLIPCFDVVTGKIVKYSIGRTRTETDFATVIARTIALDPQGEWIFVLDQLNTHMSETLVRVVATAIGYGGDLGVKESKGILKSMESRQEFLVDTSHRVRFVYTPKHCSWLNQVECWFSILTRKLLKRGNFRSKKDLRKQMRAFIRYFNRTMARPFSWTYRGRLLATA